MKKQHLPAFTAGCGAVLTFVEGGVRKIVLAQAGAHYGTGEPRYTIPGGFLNHLKKAGSKHVQAIPGKPETAYEACAREIEEELRLCDGTPLFDIEPRHFKMMDTDTLFLHGAERRIVMGMMYELNEQQVRRLHGHMRYLQQDEHYRAACAGYSRNDESGLPEIETLKVFDLADVVAGRVPLLHNDQHSLFVRVHEHFRDAMRLARQTMFNNEPTHKILPLRKVMPLVDDLRAQGQCVIGLATGDFNRLASSKIHFVNNAGSQCDFLVMDVAGRSAADNVAALGCVDAVIANTDSSIILNTLRPDKVFSMGG